MSSSEAVPDTPAEGANGAKSAQEEGEPSQPSNFDLLMANVSEPEPGMGPLSSDPTEVAKEKNEAAASAAAAASSAGGGSRPSKDTTKKAGAKTKSAGLQAQLDRWSDAVQVRCFVRKTRECSACCGCRK